MHTPGQYNQQGDGTTNIPGSNEGDSGGPKASPYGSQQPGDGTVQQPGMGEFADESGAGEVVQRG